MSAWPSAEVQLQEELGSVTLRWTALLGLDLLDVLSQRIRDRAGPIVDRLEQGAGALDVLLVLHPDTVPDEWWRTPLGQLVARAGGVGDGGVTQAQAARMLGVSRPRISALVAEGKLPVGDDGRVLLSGVGQRLGAR